jgi:anti-sigma regulatory factor (Ser/Thr protein kinase)
MRRQVARPGCAALNGVVEPTVGASFDESYPAVAESVAHARRSVGRQLHEVPQDALMIGDVELALSEACTNVVVHAYVDAHAGAFRVRLDSAGESVIVTVSDNGGGMVPRPDSPGLGLGLPLMAALTDRLDVAPAAEGSGTVVCMHFSAAGAHSRLAAGSPDT